MKKIVKKIFIFVIAAGMLLNLTSLVSAGAVIPVSVSDSFKKSIYYEKANYVYSNYQNVSDAELFVRMALSQKGYIGSAKKGVYDGSGKTRGTYTEYSRYMKKDGLAWCACFVSWAAKAAGISEKVIVPGAVCGHWMSSSPNGGKFVKIWSNDFKTYKDYKPQVGDIALYTPTCSKCGKHMTSFSKSAHVVIVCDVADKRNSDGSWTFKTIERGNNNTVSSNTLNTKSRRGTGSCTCSSQKKTGITNVPVLLGFFHPNWADGKSAPNHLKIDPKIEYGFKTETNTNNGTGNIDGDVSVTYPTSSTYLAKFQYTENNAVLVAKVTKPMGSKVNYVGMVMYDNYGKVVCDRTFSVTNVSPSSTSFHIWFDVQKEMGVTLKPGITYKYRIYTKVDNEKYVSPYWTFTTKAASVSQPLVTVNYPTNPTYLSKFKYTTNNAVLVANIIKPSGSKVNYVGLVMYDNNGKAVCDKTFSVTNVSASTTSFHAWFDVQKELGVTLKPGITYKYRIYTKVDNVKYVSPYWTFTTKS